MTEVPEHLLARSKARRAALTGEGDPSAETTPATTESASAAPAAAEAAPAPQVKVEPKEEVPEPTPPWIEAAESRKRVPVWAIPVLVAIPFFFVLYAWTLSENESTEGPLALGAETFSVSCASCHGAGGGGGVGPALSGGAVVETFPRPVDQVAWVALGSQGFQEVGETTYGAPEKPIAGGMPGQAELLDPVTLMDVVLHERVEYGQETFDIAVWEDGFEETITELVPDHAEEYLAVLEEWKAEPPE